MYFIQLNCSTASSFEVFLWDASGIFRDNLLTFGVMFGDDVAESKPIRPCPGEQVSHFKSTVPIM
jgi:hypothetical protein